MYIYTDIDIGLGLRLSREQGRYFMFGAFPCLFPANQEVKEGLCRSCLCVLGLNRVLGGV